MNTNSRPVKRLWMPATILVLAALAIAAIWARPGDVPRDSRIFSTQIIGLLALLLLTFWLVLFSGLRLLLRLLVVSLGLVVVILIAPSVIFTGDMVPVMRWPWERKPE